MNKAKVVLMINVFSRPAQYFGRYPDRVEPLGFFCGVFLHRTIEL